MADGYEVAALDDIRHSKWPRWSPIRHALGVQAFGVNLWRHEDGGDVIPEHDETESGHEELYLVVEGHCTFTLDGNEVDAPKGTLVFIRDPAVKRKGVATDPATSVLTLGGWSDKPFQASEWETEYMKES